MPLIDYILSKGHHVILASDGDAMVFLQKRYPELSVYTLPEYGIKYRTSNMYLNISYQIPRILRSIYLERKWLKNSIQTYSIDAVISDNRYGLVTDKIPSVFVTHQINIKLWPKWIAKLINRLNRFYMNRFDQVWIPDINSANNLSGELSVTQDARHSYIGPLSRLHDDQGNVLSDYILCILSGPEPMRSHFEKIIMTQAEELHIPFVLVRGKAKEGKIISKQKNIKIYDFLDGEPLTQLIRSAKYIISRSGYSTLMDLMCLKKKNILLVPTPGQTEQVYLAERMQELFGFISQSQTKLSIKEALVLFKSRDQIDVPLFTTDFSPIDRLLATL